MARDTRSAAATAVAPDAPPSPSPGRRSERRRLAAVERPPARITPAAIVAVLLVAGVVFSALAVQISLIDRQRRLDVLRAEITEVQKENKELRQAESRLQAPAEILRIARDERGMVESRPAALVTPAERRVAPATTPTDGSPDSSPDDPGED